MNRWGAAFSPLPAVPVTGGGDMAEQDEKLWSMFSHLGGLLGLGFVAPLVIYLVQKGRSPFVEAHSREALNFQLSYLVYFGICMVTMLLIIPIFILMALGVLLFVVGIIAGIRAYEGGFVGLPFTIRFLR